MREGRREHWSRGRSLICDETSDDGDDERAAASRRRDRGFAGVWFLSVYWGFFFSLDKNLSLSVFSEFLSVFSVFGLLFVEFGLLLSLICSV